MWECDSNGEVIFTEECMRLGAPPLVNGMGITMVGPMLMHYGTEEQKQRYLPHILRAEEIWCQGFSEPGSGSDFASLSTRAEVQKNIISERQLGLPK